MKWSTYFGFKTVLSLQIIASLLYCLNWKGQASSVGKMRNASNETDCFEAYMIFLNEHKR